LSLLSRLVSFARVCRIFFFCSVFYLLSFESFPFSLHFLFLLASVVKSLPTRIVKTVFVWSPFPTFSLPFFLSLTACSLVSPRKSRFSPSHAVAANPQTPNTPPSPPLRSPASSSLSSCAPSDSFVLVTGTFSHPGPT